MHFGQKLAIVIAAIVGAGILTQVPSALGDSSSNPLSAIWDAISDLQGKDKQLQAQIDELKSERDAAPTVQIDAQGYASDPYAKIEIETQEQGHTLVHITAGNNGPDRAAGVKLTAFYLMPLYEINSITGDGCANLHRGIIECTIGTLESGAQYAVTIDATARESGKANTWTVDVSTTTEDSDYTNNHVTYDFETGSGAPVVIVDEAPIDQAIEQVQPPQETQQGNSSSVGTTGENQSSSDIEQPSNSTDATTNPSPAAGNNTSDSQAASDAPQDQPAAGSSSDSGSEQPSSGEQASDQSSEDNSNETSSDSSGSGSDVNGGNSTQTVSQ